MFLVRGRGQGERVVLALAQDWTCNPDPLTRLVVEGERPFEHKVDHTWITEHGGGNVWFTVYYYIRIHCLAKFSVFSCLF